MFYKDSAIIIIVNNVPIKTWTNRLVSILTMQCRDLFIIFQLGNFSKVAITIIYGVPNQSSVLASMLFNIYIHDIPETLSKKKNYSDDIAILTSNKIWSTIESRLTVDMHILSICLKNWWLKLSAAKTLFSVFSTSTTKRHTENLTSRSTTADSSFRRHQRI